MIPWSRGCPRVVRGGGQRAEQVVVLVADGVSRLRHIPTGVADEDVHLAQTLDRFLGEALSLRPLPDVRYQGLNSHAGFVGMMTNLIMGVVASRGQEAASVLPWGEVTSLWAINLGILAFLGLEIVADIRSGAILMGLGILLAVFTMFRRLLAS